AAAIRVPFLETVLFSDAAKKDATPLPPFVSFLTIALKASRKPCCVVLPDCEGVAVAVSVILAISLLHAEFPEILRAHASISFSPGDNVLVHPSGLVYEYGGFFNQDFFKLKVLDKNESRSLPVADIARLEKTFRKRPKGGGKSNLDQPRSTVLGALVG